MIQNLINNNMNEGLMRPTVSIIMPAYNCEKYLTESVESVRKQTYRDWELIIVDDCSVDKTCVLAEKFAGLDSRIKLVCNQQNCGVGFTRNRGVEVSSGDWIALLDSDDLWEPDKLEKQMNHIKRVPHAQLLFTASAFIKEDGKRIDYILHVPEQIARRKLLKQDVISCSSVLVKREYMVRYPMPEQRDLAEDFVVWLRLLEEEPYAYGLDEPLLIYRISASSKSGNKWKAARMNWNAYRMAGLNLLEASYYMCWYAIKGLLKYKKLRDKGGIQ